jgi:hypothetical protein
MKSPLKVAAAGAIHVSSEMPMTDDTKGVIRALGSRSAVHHAVVSYIVFTVLTAVYLLPFMRIMLPHSNEGTLIYGAERIVHGDVFARDFFEVMGPGSFYVMALFFKVFGLTFLATRIWLCCSSLGIALCMYFLARRVCARNTILPCLVMAGTWFGMQWPSVSHHVDSNLFALLSVVCLITWEERRFPLMPYAAGLCAGLTAWIHQPKGTLLLIAMLFWCFYGTSFRTGRIANASRVLLGFLLVCVPACGYFISQGALGSLFYANVIWPSRNYGAVNKVPYALGMFSEYWHHWASMQGRVTGWPIVLATVLVIPFLLVALTPGVLILFCRVLRSRLVKPSVLLCVLAGWAVWLSEVHRMDIYHLAFGCPLLLVVCVGLLGELEGRLAQLALQLIAISAACLMTINLLQVVTARTVSSRVGTVGVLRPEPILHFVDAHIAPGEEVFFYPYCPDYYFLTATKNPTRFSILVYNYNTSTEFEEVVNTLESKRVKWVIWDGSFDDRTFKSVFPGVSPIPAKAQIIEPYLQSRYKQVAIMEGFRILVRNE